MLSVLLVTDDKQFNYWIWFMVYSAYYRKKLGNPLDCRCGVWMYSKDKRLFISMSDYQFNHFQYIPSEGRKILNLDKKGTLYIKRSTTCWDSYNYCKGGWSRYKILHNHGFNSSKNRFTKHIILKLFRCLSIHT